MLGLAGTEGLTTHMTEAVTAAVPPSRRVRTGTTLSFGVGAIAYGVKDNGFGTFLLLFYNQVIGLPAASVGFAIMCALILDAFIDPAIGVASDRTRTRWGRRHPWMYASALPIAIGWLLLWNPPAWSPGATLAWLFATAVMVRSAVSAYEVPSQALAPELSADYDERTRLTAYRYLFGWLGGLVALLAAYTVFLVPETPGADGLANRGGYASYSVACAVAIMLAILISAAGTHREIASLPRQPAVEGGMGQAFRELVEAVRNRAFAVLMLAGLCVYTNQGISFALSNYLYSYVWQFGTGAFTVLAGVLFAGVVIAFAIAGRVGARMGKPRAAAMFTLLTAILATLPYWLRLAGWFPAVDSPMMLPVLFGIYVPNTACSVAAMILGASMMADVVEHSEVTTGRRSEGVFFAGSFFIQKCTGGVGIFLSGLILWAADFPQNAVRGAVPVDALDRLTLIFSIVYLVIGLVGTAVFVRFPFGRAEHEARIARLAAAGAEAKGVL
jgi:GPH family glycoside/pentoside/hexuronide:cation symporter